MVSHPTDTLAHVHSHLEGLRPPGFESNYEAWLSGRLAVSIADLLSADLIRYNASLLALLPSDEVVKLNARPLPRDVERLVRILTDAEEAIALKVFDGELTLEQLPRLDWPDAMAQGIP